MKNIPKIDGFEYVKVEPLSFDQKSLAVQALGYALGEFGLHEDVIKGKILETFSSYIDRGLIL
jgi:hypothetical protein